MEQEFHRIRRLPPYVFAEVNAMKARARSEGADIIERLGDAADSETKIRYRESEQIVLGWIKRYTEFDFRSLGSYTRGELHEQGIGPDPF